MRASSWINSNWPINLFTPCQIDEELEFNMGNMARFPAPKRIKQGHIGVAYRAFTYHIETLAATKLPAGMVISWSEWRLASIYEH